MSKIDKPPIVNPPPIDPTEPRKEVHIGCSDEYGEIHLPTGGVLRLDNGSELEGTIAPPTQIHFTLPINYGYGLGATLKLSGFDEYAIETGDPGGSDRLVTAPDVNVLLKTKHKVIDLPPLLVDNIFFRTPFGPIGIIEASSFRLYKRYLDGEDIDEVADELYSLGFNTVRVFGMARNLFDFDPSVYGSRYYSALPLFITKLAGAGLYTEFTVFPDVRLIRDNKEWQIMHWDEVVRNLESVKDWVLVEPQNEVDQTPNVMDLNILNHPSWLLSCMGTYGGSGDIPPRPWKRYESIHLNLQPEWWRKPKSAMEKSLGAETIVASHVPCTVNEINRYPDQDGNKAHYFDAAAVAALLSAGICFHYANGRQSVMMTGAEKEGAIEFVKGFNSVPLKYRYGYYYRVDSADYLRIYGKSIGSERFEVKVRF